MSAATFQRLRHAIFEYLSVRETLTGTAGRLGPPDDPSIYPHAAPKSATAAPGFVHVVFKRNDEPRQRTLTATRGLRSAMFDFEVWGDDSHAVEAVTEALRDALEAFRGDFGNVSVRAVTLEGEVDDAARPEDGSDELWFVTVLSATFAYQVLNDGGG